MVPIINLVTVHIINLDTVVLPKNVADAIIMNMHVSVIKKHTHGDAINANPIHAFAMITPVILDQYVMLILVILVIIAVMLVKKM